MGLALPSLGGSEAKVVGGLWQAAVAAPCPQVLGQPPPLLHLLLFLLLHVDLLLFLLLVNSALATVIMGPAHGPTSNRKAKKQQSSNRMSRVGRLLPVVITSIADFDDDDDWRSASCHFTRCKRKETDRSASHWSLLAAPSSVLGHWLRTAALTLSREKFIGESVKAPAHSTKCNAGHADCRVFRSACKEKSARFQNIQQHCC